MILPSPDALAAGSDEARLWAKLGAGGVSRDADGRYACPLKEDGDGGKCDKSCRRKAFESLRSRCVACPGRVIVGSLALRLCD